mmetsp:Transcript_13084/g.22468  ORF Transcript_13084/g.22468 Transcript_13084/m.22468 type:complete len:490 (+) Transcript_13084:419-1888(+)|eukprot:CAMPEP_0184699462 /NCGR_PEP_ID=MMETSP0313-20130426/5729_1 /TAXON_ID=2792 /ORGANISM="Porphyridium aerugineum, Strain SAG 1380-2" /LENGTH=489 /DNA_ID=CAMNT_0027158561 /DNA_START=362 /DNA_END=1831 /DNA_ORIENTATION=+
MEYQIDRRVNDRARGSGRGKGKGTGTGTGSSNSNGNGADRVAKWVGRQRERERGFFVRDRPVSLDAQNRDIDADADAQKKMTVLTKRKSVMEVDMASLDRLLAMDDDVDAAANAKSDAMVKENSQGLVQFSRGNSSGSTNTCLQEFDGLALGGNSTTNSSVRRGNANTNAYGHGHVHAYSHGTTGYSKTQTRKMNRDKPRASSIPPVPLFHPSTNAAMHPKNIVETEHHREDVEQNVLASSLPSASHMLAGAHALSQSKAITNSNQQPTHTSTCTRSSTHSSSEHSCNKKIKCDNPNPNVDGDAFDERYMMRQSARSSRDEEEDEDEEEGDNGDTSTKTPPRTMQTTSPIPPSSIISSTAKKITESFDMFDLGPRDLSDSSLSHVLHLEFEDIEKQCNPTVEHQLDAPSSSSGSYASPNGSTTENHGIRGFLSWEALDQMMENREVKETVGKENEYLSSPTTTLDADAKRPVNDMGTGFKFLNLVRVKK